MGQRISNFDAEPIDGDNPLFNSEQCLEHYNSNNNKNLDLSLIPDEVIDHVMIPLMDVKVLHYLKCADPKWRTKIEEYAKKSLPKFKFVAKLGSKGNGDGQFNGPCFVATDEHGNIYVSDCYNHRIQIFDANEQWMKSIGSNGSGNCQFNQPMGIAFNSKSHMFVVDRLNHRIVEFDQNLHFVKTFGSEGKGNGQFKNPHGIAVDADDNIVVADLSNHRLQIFSKDGNWKKKLENKDLVMVNLILHMLLLYAKQVAEYLLVIVTTIVSKYSVQKANSCSNLVQ
jgi:DNA-binding beta-propeller fold protein YncE